MYAPASSCNRLSILSILNIDFTRITPEASNRPHDTCTHHPHMTHQHNTATPSHKWSFTVPWRASLSLFTVPRSRTCLLADRRAQRQAPVRGETQWSRACPCQSEHGGMIRGKAALVTAPTVKPVKPLLPLLLVML
jgi:hypothetical protein